MTIKELYNWAKKNSVEDYEIVYPDEVCYHYPNYSYLEINREHKEVIL